MAPRSPKANINNVADEIRSLVWRTDEGALLGSEDELVQLLEVSRPTVRQAARLVEREGLLSVRRGPKGGYFAARPSMEIIESSVSAYLRTVEADSEELSDVAAAIWVLIARRAAASFSIGSQPVIDELRGKLMTLTSDAGWEDMLEIEEQCRTELLALVKSPYMELIFHINRTFARNRFPFTPRERDGTSEHAAFIKAWRIAKLLELEAIANGDVESTEIAARYARNLFHRRLWGHAPR